MWRWLMNRVDYLLGYGLVVCACCGEEFSLRPEWLPEQMVQVGPTTRRVTYCRRCARDIARFNVQANP